MIPVVRVIQKAPTFQLRAALSSASTTTPTSSEPSSTKEAEYYLDMGKFVDTIGIDARTSNRVRCILNYNKTI